jgi:acetoin utilization deacetylase AcuC-like enzyme
VCGGVLRGCTILRMQAFYADQFVLPLPDGHRFPMSKYGMLRNWLASALPEVRLQEAPPAADDALALVHTEAYIRGISLGPERGGLEPRVMREIGFPWSTAMAERARRSVGASVAAARISMGLEPDQPQGVAGNLAGGTHHSYPDKGGGFCVFNDFAVAARLMQTEWARVYGRGRPLRVAIVDLDVHQGNGTARIFQGDESVFTLSLHGEKNFPFRKENSDLDVALPDGCGDDAYLQALDQALDELEQRFFSPYPPGLLLYLAGADPHEGDRLGRLKLSYDGLEARDRRVMDWAWQRRIPLAFAMGGGYGVDLATTLRVQQNTYRVALSYWQRWQR